MSTATRREVFARIRTDPGNVSLDTRLEEVFKRAAIRAIDLPVGLFVDVSPKMLTAWPSRAAIETPSLLREHPEPVKLPLLAAYLHCREREITDLLVDLLIATVHRINARADTRVVSEFVAELKRVAGKENILFKITEAALRSPDGPVSDVIYPVVPGGVDTLTALLGEYKATGSTYKQHKAGAQGVLHQPLSARARGVVGCAGVRVDQHCARSGAGGADADQTLHGRDHQHHAVLRTRRTRPRGRCRPDRIVRVDVANGQVGADPDPAQHLRMRGVPDAAREAALQGDLGSRCRPLAQSGRGSTRRFRGQARRALSRAPQTLGPEEIRRRTAR
jgi:hypothetical protein